tara:strand:+ start:32 stop:343 length:312 start_codon:yes stop_codon:yes gene_type:complete
MSDEEKGNDDFPDFKGKPDVEEDGFTTSEIGISVGCVFLVTGFILGLIRLMALNGESNQETFDTNLEQLYLGYLLMFIGILITTVIGFGGMFKRTFSSFTSQE